jgi:hypothetical protein
MSVECVVVNSKETSELIKRMKTFVKATAKSKSKSKSFLIDAGIYTESGNLKKAYR